LSKDSAKRRAALRREPAILLFLFRPGRSLFWRINPPVMAKKTPCYRNQKRRAATLFRRSPSADGLAEAGRNPLSFKSLSFFACQKYSALLF
jgi:hypothetical protein